MISLPVVVPFNDLSRGWLANSDEAQDVCARVIKSGHYVHGPEHEAFEIELAEFLGCTDAIGVASGTDALKLALRAVGCDRGSRVVIVANAGGYASIASIEIGCEIIYCDVDPISLVMTDYTLAPLLTRDIQAVVVTHLFGNIAPVDQIRKLCEPLGISVIEDCAQAIGGRIGAQRVGTIGDISAFSFYPTKNLGGGGDGGAVVTSDPFLASQVRKLRQYGWSRKYSIDTSGGINSRLDEIQAAILRLGITKIDSLNDKRRQIITQYQDAFSEMKLQVVTQASSEATAHLAVIRVPKEIGRDGFQGSLALMGIQTAIHYPILDCDQLGLPHRDTIDQIPVSRAAQGEIISLPCFPELTSSEVLAVIATISEVTA